MIWQTRTLAAFVAATVNGEGENQLLTEALNIGVKNSTKKDDDSTTPQKRPEPNVGTYERFMSSFGSPQRWAGRG